jgi:hypothetical protein
LGKEEGETHLTLFSPVAAISLKLSQYKRKLGALIKDTLHRLIGRKEHDP